MAGLLVPRASLFLFHQNASAVRAKRDWFETRFSQTRPDYCPPPVSDLTLDFPVTAEVLSHKFCPHLGRFGTLLLMVVDHKATCDLYEWALSCGEWVRQHCCDTGKQNHHHTCMFSCENQRPHSKISFASFSKAIYFSAVSQGIYLLSCSHKAGMKCFHYLAISIFIWLSGAPCVSL